MNNRVIIGIIIVVLLAAIGLYLSGSKSLYSGSGTQTQTPSSATSPASQFSPSSNQTQQNMVTLTTDGFSPQTMTIKVGDAVTWVNKSSADATVNSAPHPAHTDYPPLNLGSFPNGGTLSLVFDKPGTYKYHNHLNPSQFGVIVVQ